MTATAFGILVDQGALSGPLQFTISYLRSIDIQISKETELHTAKLNILHNLCCRPGKAWVDALYLESNNRILLPKQQAIPIFDYLTHADLVRNNLETYV